MREIKEIIEEYEATLEEYEKTCKPIQERLNNLKKELMEAMEPDKKYLHGDWVYVYRVVEQQRLDTRKVKDFLVDHPELDWLKKTTQKKIIRKPAEDYELL